MHKRKPRSDRGKRRGPRVLPKSSGRGPRGARHRMLDTSAFGRMIDGMGGVARAGAKIGCDHTTLSRLLSGESASISHELAVRITKALRTEKADLQDAFHEATLPREAQARLRDHFDLMHKCRSQHERTRAVTRTEIEKRYCWIFGDFRRWMNAQPVPIRAVRQELAIYRVVEPLFDGIETGWMELGWHDFLVRDRRGRNKELELVEFIKLGMEREKILLRARGPDQERARRLAVATKAHMDVMTATPEEAQVARVDRERVYRENGIPLSYMLDYHDRDSDASVHPPST